MLFGCRTCRVSLEKIALADGTAILMCVDCDLIGLAHEVGQGARMRGTALSARAGLLKPKGKGGQGKGGQGSSGEPSLAAVSKIQYR